jgi:hypothetical protein
MGIKETGFETQMWMKAARDLVEQRELGLAASNLRVLLLQCVRNAPSLTKINKLL